MGRLLRMAQAPGILVKSYRPARFWARVKEQWSVATVSISPFCRASQRARRSSRPRRGGAQTYFAASRQSGASYTPSSSRR